MAKGRIKAWKAMISLGFCLLVRREAWLGPVQLRSKLHRRTAVTVAMLPLIAPASEPAFGEDLFRVVRPQNASAGEAFYSFDLPEKFKAVNRAKYQRDRRLLGKTAEFVSASGARVFTGESPTEDFVKRRRITVPRSQQKVLKYELGEAEDLLEAVVKEPQEDGSEVLKHRWWRVLKEPGGRNAIMDLELKEELLKDLGLEMEAILQSFRLNV